MQKWIAAIGGSCVMFGVQVWRPLVGPVQDSALGFVDAATLSQHDILPANLFLTEEFAIEVNYIVHNSNHRQGLMHQYLWQHNLAWRMHLVCCESCSPSCAFWQSTVRMLS